MEVKSSASTVERVELCRLIGDRRIQVAALSVVALIYGIGSVLVAARRRVSCRELHAKVSSGCEPPFTWCRGGCWGGLRCHRGAREAKLEPGVLELDPTVGNVIGHVTAAATK